LAVDVGVPGLALLRNRGQDRGDPAQDLDGALSDMVCIDSSTPKV